MMMLPYPPSVNHYWRNVRGHTLISREGRAYRRNVCALLTSGNGQEPPNDGRIALAMDAFPPDRRRRDLDNIQKPVLDAMQHAGIYLDDSQIDLLITRRRQPDKPHGHLAIEITDMPLHVCPLCKRPLPEEFSN